MSISYEMRINGEVYVKTGGKRDKGKSLLAFPKDCTVIDIETTGLDPQWDEIIELAALRVRSGQVVDRFTSLVHPECKIDRFITDLTGITNEAVADAPYIIEILPQYLDFIGTDIVVGHNVHFDVNFVYDAAVRCLDKKFQNDVVDTMRLARHVLPELGSHCLANVAAALGVHQNGEHRSLVDCETTYAVLAALEATGFDCSAAAAPHHSRELKAADITAAEGKAQPDSPLYGKVCVFTGALSIPRRDAMQAVADIGGICGDKVTKKTNFLILGNNDYCASIKDGKSTKQKKAEDLILKGQDLQILSEAVFFDMLGTV